MTLNDYYRTYSSDCTAGSSNQAFARFGEPAEHTGRISYRLSHGGERYSLLFSNRLDSTYSDGTASVANDIGGIWDILGMRVGLSGAWDAEPELWHTVTFDGEKTKRVSGAEPFFTDPIPLHAKGGEYLCYEITLFGDCFPCHDEIILNARKKTADGGWVPDKRIPAPLMIGSDRPVKKRIGFLGDSITQGIGTEYESYTHWVAKTAEGLADNVSVWDLGIGCARAYDAASDQGWLARAKQCDTVTVCFGVNDLFHARTVQQITDDLRTILIALKKAGCRTVLFTVPPFDMTGDLAKKWYAANEIIRGELAETADAVFDFAKVLGQKAPNEHMSVYGGHPNAEGCAVVAEALLAANLL